jgi:hypothetical protein
MHRKFVYVLVCQLALGLTIGACSSAESSQPKSSTGASPPAEATIVDRPDPEEEAGPSSDVVSRLIQKALQSEGSVSYRTLVQRLGLPQRVETEPIANQYVRGQVDTLRTLIYPGIEALVYDVANDSKTFLVRLSLSSARYTTPDGLRVGLRKTRVIEALGPPTRHDASAGELIYQETEATPTSMVVRVRDGRVVRIDWEFYFA